MAAVKPPLPPTVFSRTHLACEDRQDLKVLEEVARQGHTPDPVALDLQRVQGHHHLNSRQKSSWKSTVLLHLPTTTAEEAEEDVGEEDLRA